MTFTRVILVLLMAVATVMWAGAMDRTESLFALTWVIVCGTGLLVTQGCS